ncbi:MAG: ADP-forming succinate--CoA ligase subunit beta [Chloroflexota bacterium]
MKLHEYQGKELFRQAGLPVPRGGVATTAEEAARIAADLGGRVVVKAQVHIGGRGKAGGVKLAGTPDEAREVASRILGMDIKGLRVETVLIEPALEIDQEYYAAITPDRATRRLILMLSSVGGVDIEEVARTTPEKIVQVPLDPLIGAAPFVVLQAMYDAGFDEARHRDLGAALRGLYDVAVASDCQLAEINPLVITADGRVVAADAKVEIDDNALFRHPELEPYRAGSFDDEMDRQAAEQGLTYLHLGGEVGVIGNGAGLVMTTLDVVTASGQRPANFLDIGGGAQAEQVRRALGMVLSDPDVKGVIFNIFGGITRADEVAKGMLEGARTLDITVPIVVRLSGTQEEAGRALLQGSRFVPVESVQEAAQTVKELIAKGAHQ